ncbi:methionyl-tRNA formyltransferase [Anaerolineales bacterium HSG25]|nr:methionyl-tRNA formyltransferase [Anaerolineales bacterium HSG25]
MSINVVFMGTPEFAVPSLKALINTSDYNMVAVVTQPDRPKGRGRKLVSPPIKVAALEANIPVMQPPTLRDSAVVSELRTLQPDVIIVAAFGQILKPDVLTMPPHGCLNVHASLLPRWRGASPVATAIRAGDSETGITLMKMDEGLDTGPMISQRTMPISQTHTRGSLTIELAELGASLLVDSLTDWIAGKIEIQLQDNQLATKASLLKKSAGNIDWYNRAVEIERQVRAFSPWPGTYTQGTRGRFKVLTVAHTPNIPPPPSAKPGTVFKHKRQVYVTTSSEPIQLLTVQPASKKPMTAQSMLNGQPDLWNTQLNET